MMVIWIYLKPKYSNIIKDRRIAIYMSFHKGNIILEDKTDRRDYNVNYQYHYKSYIPFTRETTYNEIKELLLYGYSVPGFEKNKDENINNFNLYKKNKNNFIRTFNKKRYFEGLDYYFNIIKFVAEYTGISIDNIKRKRNWYVFNTLYNYYDANFILYYDVNLYLYYDMEIVILSKRWHKEISYLKITKETTCNDIIEFLTTRFKEV